MVYLCQILMINDTTLLHDNRKEWFQLSWTWRQVYKIFYINKKKIKKLNYKLHILLLLLFFFSSILGSNFILYSMRPFRLLLSSGFMLNIQNTSFLFPIFPLTPFFFLWEIGLGCQIYLIAKRSATNTLKMSGGTNSIQTKTEKENFALLSKACVKTLPYRNIWE